MALLESTRISSRLEAFRLSGLANYPCRRAATDAVLSALRQIDRLPTSRAFQVAVLPPMLRIALRPDPHAPPAAGATHRRREIADKKRDQAYAPKGPQPDGDRRSERARQHRPRQRHAGAQREHHLPDHNAQPIRLCDLRVLRGLVPMGSGLLVHRDGCSAASTTPQPRPGKSRFDTPPDPSMKKRLHLSAVPHPRYWSCPSPALLATHYLLPAPSSILPA